MTSSGGWALHYCACGASTPRKDLVLPARCCCGRLAKRFEGPLAEAGFPQDGRSRVSWTPGGARILPAPGAE